MTKKKFNLEQALKGWEPDIQVPARLNAKILDYVEEKQIGFWQRFAQYFQLHRFATVAVIALLLVGVGSAGVSYAATSTNPGDALYPVKIYLNEPIRTRFQFSEKSKAEWALNLAERRINEAYSLYKNGDISDDSAMALRGRYLK